MPEPFHAITCTETLCDPTCVAARVLNLPRDPDLAEPIWGQADLLSPLEDAR